MSKYFLVFVFFTFITLVIRVKVGSFSLFSRLVFPSLLAFFSLFLYCTPLIYLFISLLVFSFFLYYTPRFYSLFFSSSPLSSILLLAYSLIDALWTVCKIDKENGEVFPPKSGISRQKMDYVTRCIEIPPRHNFTLN